jgi:hypothetical protein
MMRRLAGSMVGVLFAWAALTGCAPKTVEPINVLANAPNEADLLARVFLPAGAILSGFDEPDPSGQWHIGDRLLLGFQIDKGGQRTVRFVLIELRSGVLPRGADVHIIGAKDAPPPETQSVDAVQAGTAPKSIYIRLAEGDDPALIGRLPAHSWGLTVTLAAVGGEEQAFQRDSDAVLIAVYVFDEIGRKMKTAGALAPEAYLRGGLFRACDFMRRKDVGEAVAGAAMMNAYADLLPSLYGLGEVIRETPPLARIIQPIMPPPPLWALLIPPKLDISLAGAEHDMHEDQRPLPALARGRRAYLLPLSLAISKEPALQCVLSVADPSPPFYLCAGVLGIDGVQTKDPSCKFAMRVLAARRSAAPTPAAVVSPP